MERESKLESKFEMGHEAREIISLFQKAKITADEKERLKLLEEFKIKLVRLLVQKTGTIAEDQQIPPILLTGEKKYFGDDTIFLGGGTSGQRIFLKKEISIYDDLAKAERLGKNATRKEFLWKKGQPGELLEIMLESADGKPRWMAYYKPEGGDLKFGWKYWERFVEVFGDEIVDLLQENND